MKNEKISNKENERNINIEMKTNKKGNSKKFRWLFSQKRSIYKLIRVMLGTKCECHQKLNNKEYHQI